VEHLCQLELAALDRHADHLRRAAEARLVAQARGARTRERATPRAWVGSLQRLRPALARLGAGWQALRPGRLAPGVVGAFGFRWPV
jgi:anti-sigma factor RsiW